MTESPGRVVRRAVPADLPELRRIASGSLRWDQPDAGSLVDLLWPGEHTGHTGDAGHAGSALVAEADGAVVGFALGSLRGERGHINLLAVAPEVRRRGHGSALVHAMEQRLRAAGAQRILAGGASPRFAWPGVDVRYSAAGFLFESAGYAVERQAVNMTVDLAEARPLLVTAGAERDLAAARVTVRILCEDDREAITPWLASFGGTWLDEVLMTLERPGARCHIAVRDDGTPDAAYLGFACQGVNRPDWFGPMGAHEASRGLGIGSVLLRRCLAGLHASGHDTAQIAWVGPTKFYAKAVGAYIERVFWIYRKGE